MRPSKIAIAVTVLVAVLATAPAAFAVTKPAVTTGGHTALTQTSVTLQGKVNPEGSATSYFFQYGTTKAYGKQTGPATAGAGTKTVNASAPITGLTPNTTYHYHLVATNLGGTKLGLDATFKTPKQPLGLTLLATPNPATFGGPSMLTANLSGTGNAGRTVQLKARPFPYTASFTNVGNAVVTDSSGNASFPILAVSVNTEYVVTLVGSSIASPVLQLGSAVVVHIAVSHTSVHSGTHVLFQGTVEPAEDGALYSVQKLDGTQWVGVAGSSLHHHSSTASSYEIHVKVAHSGTYRVFVGVANGNNVSSASKTQAIKVIPRHHSHH